MSSAPRPIHDAAAAFDSLPGVGPRAALRYAYWLAAQPKDFIRKFARALDGMTEGIDQCTTCGTWTETSPCSICIDPKRDTSVLCVIATAQDVRVLEDSGAYRGRYHVLGGLIDPIEGRTPDTLSIDKLLARLQSPNNQVTEVILALDPDVPGDTTAMYLGRKLANLPLNITRPARGLQHGSQIEYADGATLSDALMNRRRVDKN
ncbi:recombination protein RecR [Patescibacteria group bacterium]|nr:recombination protein RecR [Patescibacteria group bacterium]